MAAPNALPFCAGRICSRDSRSLCLNFLLGWDLLDRGRVDEVVVRGIKLRGHKVTEARALLVNLHLRISTHPSI